MRQHGFATIAAFFIGFGLILFAIGATVYLKQTTVRTPFVPQPQSSAEASSQPFSRLAKPKISITQEDLDYFAEVALGAEYGSGPNIIHKRVTPAAITVKGDPTENDRACLAKVIADFNALATTVKLTEGGGDDITITFTEDRNFRSIEPHYVEGNKGYFYYNWNHKNEITDANIVISTENLTDSERCHLIREETTQSLGLAKDSGRYSDSIFYAPWTATTSYSERDKQLIRMLYATDVPLGTAEPQVREYFASYIQ